MTDQYVPGTCNIGPAEIAIRRRVGHAGLVVTAALATALLRSDLRPPWRLTLAVPAAGAASGYLQARRRFCANFGFRGVYNFDARGHEQRVMVDQALAADRRRALQITAASAAIGLASRWARCSSRRDNPVMDDAVRDYVEAIAPEHRPLFDRLHRLVLEAHPDATVVLSYQMPTYKVGRRRLFVGMWRHGVSIYGWEQGRDAGFTARHPELRTGKGTIQLRPEDAAGIPDEEFRDLARAALDG